MKPLEEESSEAFSIVKSNSGATIAPTSFLKSKDLVPSVTTQYEPQKQKINADTELVVIDLDESIGTHGSPDPDTEEEEDEGIEQHTVDDMAGEGDEG
ncbi:hypothetical protein AArcMg_2110 [Natrarchaeobaculum sulfurireducens]|uniref:Uncharacterized protein n=1 Tax=Natrarchaeobaculum sulfurireducens TaxID=2044521 RepID=A0A346PRG3_9EURY|nr:hypothetical protein AArcMg_2110 [Natrarchaeobaculum sulfurireducens]